MAKRTNTEKAVENKEVKKQPKKIEKLTPEQEAQIPVYAQKGVEWGMCCDPINEAAAYSYGERLQAWLERLYGGTIIVDSPLAADRIAHAFAVLENLIERVEKKYRETPADKRPAGYPEPDKLTPADGMALMLNEYGPEPDVLVLESLRREIYEIVREARRQHGLTGDQLREAALAGYRGANAPKPVVDRQAAQQPKPEGEPQQLQVTLPEPKYRGIMAGIAASVRSAVDRLEDDMLCAQVAQEVVQEILMGSKFEALMREALEATKDAAVVWPYLEGQWSSYFVAWYRYYTDVLGLELDSIWQIEEQIQFGCVYPLARYVIISRRPECIHRNAAGQLHRDGGPAIRYADGFSVYALNGVRVPEWLVMTRDTDIDPRKFAEIENAEIRREFVRKVGIERIVQACGSEVLDKTPDGVYELILVDLRGRTGKVPYLKMLNPSIGVWHLEGVARDIRTVKDALAWRNKSPLVPTQLT